MDLEAEYEKEIAAVDRELRRALHGAKGGKATRTEIIRLRESKSKLLENLARLQYRSGEDQDASLPRAPLDSRDHVAFCVCPEPRRCLKCRRVVPAMERAVIYYDDPGERRVDGLPPTKAEFDWTVFAARLDAALDASATKTFELIYQKANSRGLLKGAGEDEIDVNVEAAVTRRTEGNTQAPGESPGNQTPGPASGEFERDAGAGE